MNELLQTPPENHRGAGGAGSFFGDDEEDAPQIVTVTCGPYDEHLPVREIRVGEIRRRLRDRLDLDPRSIAVLGGRIVSDDTVVTAGQTLNFTNHVGEKGNVAAGVPRAVETGILPSGSETREMSRTGAAEIPRIGSAGGDTRRYRGL